MHTFFIKLLALASAFAALSTGAPAQTAPPPGIPDGIFTAGTTALDAQGRPWAYLYISAPDADTMRGRHFAIHLKPSAAADPGAFTLQGLVGAHQESRIVAGYIERALKLGEQRGELEEKLRALYRSVKYPNYLSSIHVPRQAGDPPHPEDPPQPGEPAPAEQLASVVRRATTDDDVAATLRQLSIASPAIAMAAGFAWAGPLDVPVGQPVTLEIRLHDPVACVDIGVVGRVSLVAGQVAPLPAPGPPVQLPGTTAADHLNIKLRWALPDPLRRNALLNLGFNVWRMPKAYAVAQGYAAAPPTTATLVQLAATQPQTVRAVSMGAVFAGKAFSAADVADFAADAKTFFLSDDNNRYLKNHDGQLVGAPFADGAEVAYFVTARDLLGRDGLVSPAGFGKACHRLPPPAPTGLAVRSEHRFDEATKMSSDVMILMWDRNVPVDPEFLTTRYEVIRGLASGDPQIGGTVNDGGDLERFEPSLLTPLAGVPHGAAAPAFTDTEPRVSAEGSTCWYAVRAVFDGACGPIYSDPSPPAFASIRKVNAPAPPHVCSTDTNVPLAAVAFTSSAAEAAPAGTTTTEFRVRAVCRRVDAGVVWAQFELTRSGVALGEPVRVSFAATFPEGGDAIEHVFSIQSAPLPANAQLRCRIGTSTGAENVTADQTVTFVAPPSQRVMNFSACACSMADVPAAGPLRSSVVGAVLPTTFAGLNANGYNVYNITAGHDTPVLLQQLTGGRWADVGSAFTAMNKVSVPAGPQFRALQIVAPITAVSRCSHVRAKGAGAIAPMPLRICLTPDTKEYRIYRRIDDGPLTLISQGAGDHATANQKEISIEDSALPASSASAVYFAQMIDRHGNASPLAQVTNCVKIVAPPPTPVLLEPKPVMEGGLTKVDLSWFCAPVGVERFAVFIEPQQTGAPTPSGPGLTPGAPTIASTRYTLATETTGAYFTLFATTRFKTGRVGGPTFQPGPDFTVRANVLRNVAYKIWVQALGPTGGEGAPSKQFDFIWRTPPPAPAPNVEPKVPWPERALFKAAPFNPLVKAEALNSLDFPFNSGFRNPVGVRIGATPPSFGLSDYMLPQGPGEPFVYYPSGAQANQVDPHVHLHFGEGAVGKRPGVGALRSVLYRRGVGNAGFPDVSGDTVQVSPLIKAIAWERADFPDGAAALIHDPFIGVRVQPLAVEQHQLIFYILDTQPVIEGAAYHYYLVLFKEDGEVESVADCGEVTIPDDF